MNALLQRLVIPCLVLTSPDVSADPHSSEAPSEMIGRAEALWRSGETLPLVYSEHFPHEPQTLGSADTGINVLVDQAHQCTFATMWNLTNALRHKGFRAVGSHALFSEVLVPGTPVRTRLPIGGYRPFAWWPVPEWNVVITQQRTSGYQPYTREEQETLERWIKDGGGLIISAYPRPEQGEAGSLLEMLDGWGAKVSGEKIDFSGKTGLPHHNAVPLASVTPDWDVTLKEDGHILSARRQLGKGRIVYIEDSEVLSQALRTEDPAAKEQMTARLRETVTWAAGGKDPVGGEPRLPVSGGGAGGITPSEEVHLGNIVIFHAGNQFPELLEVYREVLPTVKDKIYEWLPTPPHDQPMYIIAASGGGGGWAVNVFEPRENGVISPDPFGIVSIFAHELAHTLRGPFGASGVHAGRSPHWNSGEAHAGWIQGKACAWYDPQNHAGKPNRDANAILAIEDEKGRMLDLKTEFQNDKMRENWGKPRDWQKLWYVFQKLDDRYGTTWYPRWFYVRNTRWADAEKESGSDYDYDLTWEQTVEDMSIAVGEDLFPFFVKLGTSLDRDRIGPVDFMGETLHLEPAPLERTPAGPVRLEAAGDYTQPIKPKLEET